jgi:hypothetical protein
VGHNGVAHFIGLARHEEKEQSGVQQRNNSMSGLSQRERYRFEKLPVIVVKMLRKLERIDLNEDVETLQKRRQDHDGWSGSCRITTRIVREASDVSVSIKRCGSSGFAKNAFAPA